ncbi:MAG: DUF2953 domain-containing protein [Halothermotrichaceae bacterium]
MIMVILLISFFVLSIFLLTPVSIIIEYQRNNQDDFLKLSLFCLVRVLGFDIKMPYINNKIIGFVTEFVSEVDSLLMEVISSKEDITIKKQIKWHKLQFEKIKQKFAYIKTLTLFVKKANIKCEKFKWITELGLADPAVTGISTGFLWIFKGIIINILDDNMDLQQKPDIDVLPAFYSKKLNTFISSIFSIRLGNIIHVVLNMIFYKIKGRCGLWENIQLKN